MESKYSKQYNNHQIACDFQDARGKDVVIFCHGYRSNSVGPSRHFVTMARYLAGQGISSLRFDQYGSGNSEGSFYDSSFNNWLGTTTVIVKDYLDKGYRVALFGQSMGAATAICVAADVPELTSVAAWVPDPNVESFTPPADGMLEEGGQIVQAQYWQEAHDADTAGRLRVVTQPVYIVQCSDDEYVSPQNHQAINDNAQPHHIVEMFDGYKHSDWSYEQAQVVIDKTVNFLIHNFKTA